MASNARVKTFVQARLRRCRQAMRAENLDALIVTDPKDVTYLSGFLGEDSVLLVSARRCLLVTDSRFTEQLRRECPDLKIFCRREPMADAVAQVCARWKLIDPSAPRRQRSSVRIGIEAGSVTVTQFKHYCKPLGRALVEVEGLFGQLRLYKDELEIQQLRRAIRIAEAGMTALKEQLAVGWSEREAAACLEYEMAVRGSLEPSFPTISAFGSHGAQPHAIPSPRTRLKAGQPCLFDWGACYEGYRSDLTRCGIVGRIRPVFAEAYRRVLESQHAAIEVVKPGARVCEVDAAARAALVGVDGAFSHGTGHGIGLDVHEGPGVSPRSAGELAEGMVITIEPGVYRPGRFGIRIEDDVLVTRRGCSILSTLPKDLDSLVLPG